MVRVVVVRVVVAGMMLGQRLSNIETVNGNADMQAGRCLHSGRHPVVGTNNSRLEDLFAVVDRRPPHVHHAVKPPRPQQRIVEDVHAVGGAHQQDLAVVCEAVQLIQQLQKALLPLLGAGVHRALASGSANGIDLVCLCWWRLEGRILAEHLNGI